jgi:hypothetical protein
VQGGHRAVVPLLMVLHMGTARPGCRLSPTGCQIYGSRSCGCCSTACFFAITFQPGEHAVDVEVTLAADESPDPQQSLRSSSPCPRLESNLRYAV